MKAIVITQPGAPEVLQIQERPIPAISATEVLLKVAAAGVNRPDVSQRKGNYPPPPGASVDIPGLEVAGIIIEVGSAVTRWKVGDAVCALLTGAGYAEYCAIPAELCLPVPANLSLVEAASLPETFFTVWSNVFDRVKLQPGESILIHGGSSGIGVAAIQMAKAFGCTVFVTAGSANKLRFCKALGADYPINYKSKQFVDVVLDVTEGKGLNVILDMIGGDYTPDNLKCLANDGRLVMINAMNGREVKIDLLEVMRKRLVITGSMLRSREVAFKAAIAKKLEQCIWPLLTTGQIKPVIYKTFPATEAAQAHHLMESSEHTGKIVLTF